MSCDCGTFLIESNSYAIYLTKPIWGGEDRNITKDVKIFDFWSGAFDTIDNELTSEPLRLGGVEEICGINEGLCFPMCFPLCFSKPLSDKFGRIHDLMNKHEKIKITGLGDCMDGYYVIRNFHYSTIRGAPSAYRWSLSLERVRDV